MILCDIQVLGHGYEVHRITSFREKIYKINQLRTIANDKPYSKIIITIKVSTLNRSQQIITRILSLI